MDGDVKGFIHETGMMLKLRHPFVLPITRMYMDVHGRYACICMYVCVYACSYVCMHVRVYACMHVSKSVCDVSRRILKLSTIHRHVITLFGLWKQPTSKRLFMVLEYCAAGNLFDVSW